jgi:hypothetical protein
MMRGALVVATAWLVACSGGSSAPGDAGGTTDGTRPLADATMSSDDASLDAQASGDASDAHADASADGSLEGAAGPLPDYQSGTRLRAMVYETPDGTKLWHGWFDSTLSTNCSFSQGLAEDGATRCMPPATGAYYADPGCTTQVAVVETGCAVPSHVSVAVSGEPCRSAAYALGAAVDAGMTAYAFEGTTCTPMALAGTAYSIIHIAATSLVGATPVTDPRSPTLGAGYWRTDDGALQSLGAVDVARSAACAPLTGAYAAACSPTDLVFASGLFADMACTAPAARKFNLACSFSTTHTVEVQSANACGQVSIALSALGAPLSGAPWTLATGGSCTAATTPGGYTDYALGAAIPASSLPAVTTVDVGAGRIVTRYLRASTGEAIAPTTWVDSQLGAPCTVQPTASGLRCLPGDYDQQGYSDMNCTNPVVFVGQPTGCAVPTPPAFVQWSTGSGTCSDPQTSQSLQVGAQLSGVVGVYDNVPTCGSTAIDPNGLAFFSATAIAPATLPVITDVTE